MWLSANSSWFTFSAQGGEFGVYAFSGVEKVCRPYEFSVELVSRSANVDVNGMLGTPACLSIADKSGGKRLVHGLIREMEQLHTANAFTHYRAILVPRLWFLGQIIDHRIFQNLSVVEIIQQILQEQGFDAAGSSFKLSGQYEPREYCVQYGETDLHFITRLCEEEGIYFYFEHSEGSHTLCFCDREGGPKIPGESDLRFYSGSGHPADTAVIARLQLHQKVNSNASAYQEWNFTQPKLDLYVKEQESDAEKAPVPSGMLLEQYKYPHLYELRAQGARYAKLQLDRGLTFGKWIECESDVSRWLPSYTFSVQEHPRDDVNAGWWVVAVHHNGEQPGVLEHEAPSERGLHYNASVLAIPEATRFIPDLDHPKNRVIGQQTAIVTGPEGEEIYPDKYGRVKVQFFWDREGQWDEKTTCWIRASQGWAGTGYGAMAIPRIGHEVIVSFLEGNPDRPLIIGRVYHDLNKVPYELPTHKTRTVFKSMSTPGKENEERGFNEFRIEDKKGEEEIYIHAEKDVNVHVKHDWKEHILHDRHQTVDNNSYTRVKAEDHWIIEKPRKVELLADDHLTVKGDSHAEYCTKWLAKIGQEIHFKAGDKVVIEAGSDLTVKGGGAFIRLTPAGVVISGGKVKINEGGSPGNGSGAAVILPDEAIGVDAAGRPVQGERKRGEGENTATNAGASSGSSTHITSDTSGYLGKSPTNCQPYDPAVHNQMTYNMRKKLGGNLGPDVSDVARSANEKIPILQKSVMDAEELSRQKPQPGTAPGYWDYLKKKINPTSSLDDKLNTANGHVNQYKYAPDPKDFDDWKSPLRFLSPSAPGMGVSGGDCEDYAILKYTLLRQAGVPKENMKILALRNPKGGPGHAVLVVDDPATGTRHYLSNNNELPITAYEPMYYVDENQFCEF